MARPPKITARDLTVRLMAQGPVSAADLALALRVDRSTVTRTLASLGQQVIQLGATRRTRHALRRRFRDLSADLPLYRINAAGQASHWATLSVLHGGWHLTWPESNPPPAWFRRIADQDGLSSGFPFFLGDIRPQGFLGRAIARRLSHSHLLPDDPRHWSDDDTLLFLATTGTDPPGDLVVGDACLRQALELIVSPPADTLVAAGQEAKRYPEMAARAAIDPPPGSSAGGEQPKFTALVQARGTRPVLVKFSPPLHQQTGLRWAGLLVMEYHALSLLAELGFSEPGHRLIDAGDRRFLEAPRFDRTPQGGRLGVVTLEALHSATLDSPFREWTESVERLRDAGLVTDETVHRARCLQSFGELIGNSDMHAGNLAFHLTDQLPFQPAPAYDMLPMLWAPNPQGEIIDRPFQPRPPVPASFSAWRQMLGPAREFWHRVSHDERLSNDLSAIARAAGETLAHLHRRFG